jgi:murein L,D-transpeptidase YcbB/YkuD
VRLSDPTALALLVLRDRPEWTKAKIDSAIAKPTPTTIRLKTPTPVYLFYGTAVGRDDGSVQLFADVYHHDATLEATLRRGYPY